MADRLACHSRHSDGLRRQRVKVGRSVAPALEISQDYKRKTGKQSVRLVKALAVQCSGRHAWGCWGASACARCSCARRLLGILNITSLAFKASIVHDPVRQPTTACCSSTGPVRRNLLRLRGAQESWQNKELNERTGRQHVCRINSRSLAYIQKSAYLQLNRNTFKYYCSMPICALRGTTIQMLRKNTAFVPKKP